MCHVLFLGPHQTLASQRVLLQIVYDIFFFSSFSTLFYFFFRQQHEEHDEIWHAKESIWNLLTWALFWSLLSFSEKTFRHYYFRTQKTKKLNLQKRIHGLYVYCMLDGCYGFRLNVQQLLMTFNSNNMHTFSGLRDV